MALSRNEQRAIVRADSERRQARELDEYIALTSPSAVSRYDPRAYANPELIKGIGIISPPRRYPRQAPRIRVVGFADTNEGIALAHEGVPSVKVTLADGTVETRPVSSYRAASRARQASRIRQTVQPTMSDEQLASLDRADELRRENESHLASQADFD